MFDYDDEDGDYNDYRGCKYAECLPTYLKNCEIIEDKSDPDRYAGYMNVTLYDRVNNLYYYVEYDYGSCSYCDDWERRDLTDEQITKEIDELVLKMTEEQYKVWKSKINDVVNCG